MRPEAQRIAIASASGWKRHKDTDRKAGYEHCTYDMWWVKGKHIQSMPPDYLNDLNAMQEAEKMLTRQQKATYCIHLYDLADRANGVGALAFTTPAQRAEAFLRTKGLWTE